MSDFYNEERKNLGAEAPDIQNDVNSTEVTEGVSEVFENIEAVSEQTENLSEEQKSEVPFAENTEKVNSNFEHTQPTFNVTVKKSGIKRYIALAVVAGFLNVAVIGSLFFAGYKVGTLRTESAGTSNVLANLKKEPEKKVPENSASETVNLGQELSTVEISKRVGPAVVGITSKISNSLSFFSSEMFSEGTGSGIIISSDGYIVTNNHVIDGASAVSVTLNTGSEYEAKLVGTDKKTDLAVLKIKPEEELTVAELGDSSIVEVGEKAVAIGNPLGMEFFGSTTQGIISAVNRTVTVDGKTMSLIQTDAAINEGNSGGALVNAYGQVIGINAVKVAASSVEGMGFAIPISEAKPVVEDLIKFGYVKGRPVIGIASRDVTEYMAARQGWPMGVQVMEVYSGTGAEIAGLEQGDIIVKVDGKEVKTTDDLNKIKDTHMPGENLQMEVFKYDTGLKEKVSVKLSEERPD